MTRRFRIAAAAAAVAAVAAMAWLRCGALPAGFLEPGRRVSTDIVDREGVPLYQALSAEGGRSHPITALHLPATLVAATLAAEDDRFYRHAGIDPLSVARALLYDLRALRMVQGGSTITQQVAKMLMHRPRTASGKLREAAYALRLEHRLSKDAILALYLSLAPYGNEYAGAEAASQGYFGVGADALTPAQAAFLAGLPQRPTTLNPYRNLEGAMARQRYVLGRMEETGRLPHEETLRALGERLQLRRDPRRLLAAHFVERVRAAVPEGSALRVETTLDVPLQRQVQGILAVHRERLLEHGAHNVAVAVLDNRTGEWLAWEGSGDASDEAHGGAIDGVITPRQPGSALKPFTYALAFEDGFTPASVLPDLPSHFPTAQPGVLYSPRNYDGVFRGPMRARQALAGSENVPAVYLLSQVGVPDLLRLLRRAGLTSLDKTPDYYGYGLTMGDAEVRLDELVAAYSALARGGQVLPPRMLRAVVGTDGVRRATPASDPERIVSARTAFWVSDILSDDRARAWSFGSGGSLDFPFPVAAKTGTSQAYHDNWTIGFTRDVTVGVWVGNFDREPLQNSSGVTGAAPIFHDVLLAAQQRATGRLPEPGEATLLASEGGLEQRPICALSGLPATDACPSVESEWLPEGEQPVSCAWHPRVPGRSVVAWPAAYRGWARRRGLIDDRALVTSAAPQLPPAQSKRVASTRAASLAIVSPPSGSTYLRDPTLRDEFQTVPLRAVADQAAGTLTWAIDGRVLGTASSDGSLDWPLAAGRHTVTVADAHGRRDEASILVK